MKSKLFLFMLMVLLLPTLVSATPAPPVDVQNIFELMHINWELFLQLSVGVAIIVAAIKRRISEELLSGWRTHAVTAAVGVLLATVVNWPSVISIVALSIGLYLFPVGSVGAGKSLLEFFNFGKKSSV